MCLSGPHLRADVDLVVLTLRHGTCRVDTSGQSVGRFQVAILLKRELACTDGSGGEICPEKTGESVTCSYVTVLRRLPMIAVSLSLSEAFVASHPSKVLWIGRERPSVIAASII